MITIYFQWAKTLIQKKQMTTSLTGKLRNGRHIGGQSGFSLLEVVLCVVLLSTGLIAVNQTLLKSLSILSYAENRFEANRVAENKIWDVQNQVWHENKRPNPKEEGMLLGSRKTFPYSLISVPSGGAELLYEMRLKIEWQESGKNKGLSRAFYASLEKLPKP